MIFGQKKYWLEAIIKNPSIAKWYFHWRSSLDGRHTPLGDELPWVTYGAIDWFDHHLTKDMVLFEWGAGGSTTFFSKRVKQVISIEHDSPWYEVVVNALEKKTYKNVSLKLIEPVPSENIDPWYTTTDSAFIGYSFELYIRAIDSYPDAYFDIVFVDGRARPGCIRQALIKIKSGGFLILDNSDRLEYDNGKNLISGWRITSIFGPGPYVNYPTGTTIWQCPI
jgi:hypothetical protein